MQVSKLNQVLAWILVLLCLSVVGLAGNLPTDLYLRGYSVIPSPRKVQLQEEEVDFDESWRWEVSREVGEKDISVRFLLNDLRKFYSLTPARAGSGSTAQPVIRLSIDSHAVVVNDVDPEIARQAYRLRVHPGGAEIIGNDKTGLFYGIQTFLQLPKRADDGRLKLPLVEIEDWPDYQLRFLHWDTKNHQDKFEALKHYLDWAARFKINMISFEIWDKFQFPSYPFIGVPGAFSPQQLQELVDYGLERHIQIVPNIQAPAHFQWALKHPQLAHLRADGSDYQACMCDEETYQVIFRLYDDIIEATRGVDWLHVSTDEVYYSGICEKCPRPYNPENRSKVWVQFVQRAHEYLKKKGRRVIIWAEWPLMPEHVSMLPAEVVDGVLGDDYFVGRIPQVTRRQYIEEENRHGIRQLAYTAQTPTLAPINFRDNWRNLYETYRMISSDAREGNPIGVFGAGWDDRGPHWEFHMLGWSEVAQYGWTSQIPSVIQHVDEFVNVYYGTRVSGIPEIYDGLAEQSDFYSSTWDRVPTEYKGLGTTRESYGNSVGKYPFFRPLSTETLPTPPLPNRPGLDFLPVYTGPYRDRVEQARKLLPKAMELKYEIVRNMARADRNQYSLEILDSVAEYVRHFDQLLVTLSSIESALQEAREKAAVGMAKDAVANMLSAHQTAADIVRDRKETFEFFRTVWSKSRRPEYLTRQEFFDREESMNLEGWMDSLAGVIRDYARANDIPLAEIDPILNQQ